MARKGSLTPVGALISKELPPAFQIALRLSEMERKWELLVGPQLAQRSRPVSLDRTGLVVICETPAAAQLLNMSAGTLLRRVERRWGLALKGVRTVVGRVDKPRQAAEAKPRKFSVPEKAVSEALERIGPEIEDPGVALALARLEAAAKTRWGEGKKKDESKGR
jgi:hypothetical protein